MNNEENKKIMAKNIERLMERKGVTNQQVCDALGFKYTTFMDWRKGITYPRIGKVEAMAEYFGVLKSDLIEDKPKEYYDMQEKNDRVMAIVKRLRTDDDFLSVVEDLDKLDADKLNAVRQMLSAFI